MNAKKVFYSLIILVLLVGGVKVGYNLGTEKGYQKGYEKGHKIGGEVGYSYGYNKGYSSGYSVGHDGLAQQLKNDLIDYWCNPYDLIIDNGYTETEWLIIELFEADQGC